MEWSFFLGRQIKMFVLILNSVQTSATISMRMLIIIIHPAYARNQRTYAKNSILREPITILDQICVLPKPEK